MKKVDNYINLPYNYIIQYINDESGAYFYARILELDGCQSTGDTFEEAYKNVKEACAEAGITIMALEAQLGFPRSSICKWDVNTSVTIRNDYYRQ